MLTTPSARPRIPRVTSSLRASVIGARRPLLAAALLQRPVEGVEHHAARLQASEILPVLQGDAGDEGGEPARLFTLVPLVSQIDVVDDVRDVAQRRVVGSPAGEQHLERSHLALVRKPAVQQSEAELAGAWTVS